MIRIFEFTMANGITGTLALQPSPTDQCPICHLQIWIEPGFLVVAKPKPPEPGDPDPPPDLYNIKVESGLPVRICGKCGTLNVVVPR